MEKGTILAWLKKEGESYQIGELLYEVETEKVTVQVEAKRLGTLARIVAVPGVELPVGALLAVVADPGEKLSESDIEAAILAEQVEVSLAASGALSAPEAGAKASPIPLRTQARVKAFPKARVLAEKFGIDLTNVVGTGQDGAITVDDVERAVSTSTEVSPRVRERRLVRGIARSMAEAVMRSWREIPQFTQMIWVDARALMEQRLIETPAIRKSHGFDLSLNDLIIHAVVQAVKEVPEVNSSFSDDEIVVYEDVNLSVAIATDAGLIVPVIHKAQTLSLGEMGAKLRDLTTRVRAGSLKPEDVHGGTITISNLGMFGIETGTPIITPPQAAIVFVGAMVEKPVVREQSIKAQPTIGIAIAYDHRVLDGRTAARFTTEVKRRLESTLEDERRAMDKPSSAEIRKASTLARKLAERRGVSLEGIEGTGVRGRIMQADVMSATERRQFIYSVPETTFDQVLRSVAQMILEFPHLKATIKGDEISIWSNKRTH